MSKSNTALYLQGHGGFPKARYSPLIPRAPTVRRMMIIYERAGSKPARNNPPLTPRPKRAA